MTNMQWKNLTVSQAQYIYSLAKSVVDAVTGFEAKVKAISFLTGTSEDEINKWDLDRFTKELSVLDFMDYPIPETKAKRRFTVNNQRYLVNYDIKKISYGNYLQAVSFSSGPDKMIKNLHLLMASVVVPVNVFGQKQKKDRNKISDDMLNAPFLECCAVSRFYYKVFKEFLKKIPDHIKKELTDKGMDEKKANAAIELLYETL